jgi:glycosyltransferase involved in cell wall biosynthesis
VRRPGLVVVSPLPPAWSGIADYTARLIPHLREHWDVSVVVANGDPEPTFVADEVQVFRVGAWRWAQSLIGAERMLLCLGNSQHHLHVPELCDVHGGVVLAHDVRMTALHCLRAAASLDRHQLSRIVDGRHGPELAREIRALEVRAPVAESFAEVRRRLEDANALLFGAAIPGAHSVCVHSRLAARLARLELHDTGIPVSVVPFGCPSPGSAPREPIRGRIASFGMVEPEKQPALLLEALAVVRTTMPEATLRFVGPLGGGMADLLGRLASRLGVAEAVSWTDRVDDAEYRDELARAAVSVQLRAVVNGEASAAAADCLAAGIPTIVTAIGAHAELPTGATIQARAGASAHEIADHLRAVLSDRDLQQKLSRAALEHAERSSFSAAAAALTEKLSTAPPIRY